MGRNASLPVKQADLLARAVSDAALLVANPYTYGITPSEAAQFNAAVQDFKVKMDVVTNPATKTKAAVQMKNESKQMLLYTICPLLKYIRDNAGVADDAKVALGLTVGVPVPSPTPLPTTEPQLNVTMAARLQHMVSFADATTPKSRRKPAGMFGMNLFCQIGDTPTIDPANAKYVATITKQPFVMNFPTSDIGKSAHYWGYWLNHRGVPGPLSQVASLTISG